MHEVKDLKEGEIEVGTAVKVVEQRATTEDFARIVAIETKSANAPDTRS
jgi:hypothetical protein